MACCECERAITGQPPSFQRHGASTRLQSHLCADLRQLCRWCFCRVGHSLAAGLCQRLSARQAICTTHHLVSRGRTQLVGDFKSASRPPEWSNESQSISQHAGQENLLQWNDDRHGRGSRGNILRQQPERSNSTQPRRSISPRARSSHHNS